MISSIAQADLVSLIAGEIDAATLASRHGVTEEEALRWRAVFVAGMKAGVGGRTASRRLPSRMIGVASAVLATAAFAQLAVFSPNSPALATEVNGNFTQLKAWLETKVGPVTNTNITTAGSVTATTVAGGTVNSTGAVNAGGKLVGNSFAPAYADWNGVSSALTGGSGIVNDNVGYKALMVVGNTSAGGVRKVTLYDDATVSGDLAVSGNVWGPATDVAEGTMAQPSIVWTNCPAGKFVCGIGLGHNGGDGNYWTGSRVQMRCCAL